MSRWLLVIVVLSMAHAVVQGQAPAPAPQAPTPVADTARQLDLIDLWRRVRKRPPTPDADEPQRLMIAAAPVIGWNPTFGLTFGAAAQVAFAATDDEEARLSSLVTSLSYSTKHQTLFNARYDIFTRGNTWFAEGDNRVYLSGQTVYGLGSRTRESAGVDGRYTLVRIHDTAYRRVTGPFYLGAGFLFDSRTSIRPANNESDADWATSAFVTYSEAHGLPLESQQSAGMSVNLLVDRRVGGIDPRHGWLLQGWYRWSFAGFAGGETDWQRVHAEWRSYLAFGESASVPAATVRGGVPNRHRIAVWVFTDLTTSGGPPYFDLPDTVSDTYGRSSRGYVEGRYRGERLVYGEVEYRGMLTRNGLLGVVGFANVATLTNSSTGEQLFDDYAPAAGGGLRLLFNKHSRTNFCVDVAFGKDGAKGMYFAIQDAF